MPELLRLEDELAATLDGAADGFYGGPRPAHFVDGVVRYAELAWQAAMSEPRRSPDLADQESFARLAMRPVFVVGAHRSGTTLLRNLLDGHPDLCVLPVESNLLTQFGRRLRFRSRRQCLSLLTKVWIGRLVHSDGVPPYWLLGRSGGEDLPYVQFARRTVDWSRTECIAAYGRQVAALLAILAAYDRTSSRLWVEKSPGHEAHTETLRKSFPDAVFIHLLRDPRAAFESRRKLQVETGGAPPPSVKLLGRLRQSFVLAGENLERIGAESYHIVRYEDVIRDPEGMLRKLARALDIPFDAGMLVPTVAGRPARPNSSFDVPAASRGIILSQQQSRHVGLGRDDRALIRDVFKDAASGYGYDL